MYSLAVENKRGQQLVLTGRESDYQIVNIDGLNPPNAIIQSTTVAGMDGTRFASSKLGERNLVLTIKINGDVESNRLYLYRYFRTKQYCKIYFENGARSVYAEGYVETIECSYFEIGQTMQVSIVCQEPYFKSIDEITYDLSQVIGAFEFPFAFGGNGVIDPTDTDDAIEFSIIEKDRYVNVVNDGESVTGFIIEIQASGGVSNPTIYCVDTNESFSVKIDLVAGDMLIIDTISGEKSVKLNHNGEIINCLKYVQRNSAWLKLEQGDNQFTYGADVGQDFIQMSFRFRTKYEAV